MDIIQGLVQAGSTAGRPALRIVSNNRTFDVINTVTSNVIFSILNDGSVGAGSTIYTNLITNYADSSSGGSVSTGGTGGTGVSSQWTTVGSKIYYNLGNIGIGTLDPIAPLHIYNNTITAVLPTEIVVAGATSATISGTTDRVISFPYTSDSSGLTGQTQYTFTTTEALICDILIVGGGGGGARRMGGGGGAGALIYITNQNLTAGAYTINIGNGGAGSATSGNIDNSSRLSIKRGSNGFDSEILFNSTAIFRAKGGGGGLGGDTGSDTIFPNEYSPLAGGSGGGNGGKDAGAGGLLSTLNIVNGSLVSVINNNASDSVNPSYVGGLCFGNEGGRGGGNDPWLGSGGGGAGSRGTDVNTLTTAQLNNVNTGGVGGAGKVINITGSDITYAGGGGGGIFSITGWPLVSYYNDGGIGGGGRSGTNTLDPVQGTDGTGGGGGGDGPDRVGGARGGSGIIIIRYRRQTQSSVSNARLLLDATTTGTASIEFRRGVGADMQNDFRIINDTNSSLKLQCENSALPTQVFGNANADLAWFSSNETIIHKNTTMNGRVGVGTVYHATRTLDVVGDANVSGTVSMGNLNISSSNSVTITNTITSNTTLTIGNTSLPILITPATDYTTSITTEGTPSIIYQTNTFTFNQGNVIAYYKFNNSSSLGLDSNPSSTKYNLTPTIVGGTGGYNSNIAIEGGSLQATNDGDRLEGDFPLKSIFDNSTTGISVSCWFYKTSATYDNSYYSTLFIFTNPSDANQDVHFTTGHYNNLYYLNFATAYTSGQTYASGFSPNQTLNTWYHVVFIITKLGNVKVYVNGNLVTINVLTSGSSVYPLPQCPNTTKLRIYNLYGSGAFSGNIDEFYVFNKELSQAEVTNLYNKTYSLPNNTWNVNFPTSTSVIINNGSPQNVIGDYTVSVSNNSSVIPADGQPTTPYPSTAITTIAIKYVFTSSSSTIELLRGTTSDVKHDWKVGNYSGEFKVISSVSNTDTDYIKISTSGAITNPTGTASWNTGSDRRIKENIERASYDKCFENINKLELNRFNYVSGFNTVNRDKTQLGFIAQEVNDIFPKAISSQEYYTNELCIPDLLSIDITQINYSLYGAVKKLIKINKDQETKFDTFDRRLKTIETALNIVTEPIAEPITSNIIVDIVEPITSNIIVDIVEPITSNIIVDIVEPITSNLATE